MTGYQKEAILKAATNFAEEIQRIFEQPRSPEAEQAAARCQNSLKEVLRGRDGQKKVYVPSRRTTPFKSEIKGETTYDDLLEAAGARDWEILVFDFGGSNPFSNQNDDKTYGEERLTLEECLYGPDSVEDGYCKIHSVRRPSDNTTWTVGDTSSMGSIKAFKIENVKDMGAILENGHWINIRSLNKSKNLFTTADGAEIEEGADVWELSNGNISQLQFYKNKTYSGKLYSTEEAAQTAYAKWVWEQPVLSVQDLWDSQKIQMPREMWTAVVEIAKSKLASK